MKESEIKALIKKAKNITTLREDGRVEYHCKHGIGHGQHIHGCDGCCKKKPLNKIIKNLANQWKPQGGKNKCSYYW